jgi:hypothetical protein
MPTSFLKYPFYRVTLASLMTIAPLACDDKPTPQNPQPLSRPSRSGRSELEQHLPGPTPASSGSRSTTRSRW